MALFPRAGGKYWIVTDFYERFHVVPVRVRSRCDMLTVRLLGLGLIYQVTRRELFGTEQAARKRARKLNKQQGVNNCENN